MARLENLPINERKMVVELDCSGYEQRRPWVTGPPLSERRVAIVSTAALNVRSDAVFLHDAADYRVIPGDTAPADIVMSHISVNFDRTGFQQDVNVCFPLERLHELADEGVIGSVADFHYTVAGSTDPSLLEAAAGDMARQMKREGVDTVLLVPIWPRCTLAVGGLAIFLEEAGLATTGISLIRINTEKVAPPRALWVPFELGRPLGAPNDPAFQRRVLMAALGLLDVPSGPVLTDFPDDAPPSSSFLDEDEMEGLVCALPLRKLPDEDAPASELGRELLEEIGTLAPWYNLARAKRGRTTVGPSGLDIDVAAKYLAAFLEDQATRPPRGDLPAGRVLKLSYEDLKAYYGEAITAQPGFDKSGRVEDWIFNETVLGKALWRLQDVCAASDDAYYRYLSGKSIIPDRQVEKHGG